MYSIAFIDTEIDPKRQSILDIGSIKDDGSLFHKASVPEFTNFIKGTQYICGHNIINHDLKYIGKILTDAGIKSKNIVDTLFLSPLLFPTKPYHALLKDDKLQTEETNNPLNDSIKAKDLFFDEISAFQQIDDTLKQIFYLLLKDQKEFQAFFQFINYQCNNADIKQIIRQKFENSICAQIDLTGIITTQPIQLAYCLSLINSIVNHGEIHSITPPWVLKNYPDVEQIMFTLRNKPCVSGCAYCNDKLNINKGLKRYFGFDAYRTFAGEPLQEKAVKAAIESVSVRVMSNLVFFME